MSIKFCSLGSGSSGNCYYLGNESKGILIDAGVGVRQIISHLKASGILVQSIMGILITHNHFDHIKSLKVFTNKYKIPVFTSAGVWKNILESPLTKDISTDCIRKISSHKIFNIGRFSIEAFPVSHDAPETLGFHICYKNRKITIATDLGYICENASKFIKAADFLVIESNYDDQMLQNGSYPHYLKERIRSNKGHLDNQHISTFLAENIHKDLTHICLAHLSNNNNTPQIVRETIFNSFKEKGNEINGKPKIIVLERYTPSEFIILHNADELPF